MASRAFKDINLSFKRHPVTNDLVAIKNEDAIKRSVKNIIFTILGEKPFSPNFGSFVTQSLFDLTTGYDSITLEDEIKNVLYRFEPRIDNVRIDVSIYPDSNEVNATIQYDIVGEPSPSQIVDVLLFPARV